MTPKQPTAQEEADFLSSLFTELDTTAPVSCIPRTPVKPKLKPRSPAQKSRALQALTPCKHQKKARSPHSAAKPHRISSSAPVPSQLELDAMFEDVDWDMEVTVTPQKERKVPVVSMNTIPNKKRVIDAGTRCRVEAVTENEVNGKFQKTLTVLLDGITNQRCLVILQDDWTSTQAYEGDIINVLGPFEHLPASTSSLTLGITISSKSNLLILYPDLLITSTALSNGLQCRRRPLLSLLVHSSSDVTPALIWGDILHSVMQSCLSAQRWEERWMDENIDEAVLSGLGDLLKLNVTVEQAKREVKARAVGLQTFSQKYMSSQPKSTAILSNTRSDPGQTSLLAITELLDVEEDIWSPRYGIKGKIDATVQTIVSETSRLFPKPTTVTGPKPLEIKTGRNTAGLQHRAQTMLYNILASERYGVEVSSGLLYYTQSEEVVQVSVTRNELRGLMIARNEMAGYIVRRYSKEKGTKVGLANDEDSVSETSSVLVSQPFLPPTIDDERTCKRCYSLDTCMLYRRAVENVVDTDSPIADAYALKTGHLTPAQADFFKQWENLISLEEQDMGRFRRELWTMGARERELKGRCFASMILDTTFKYFAELPGSRDTRIHQHTYRFVRDPASGGHPPLLSVFLNAGDAITISVEPHLLALSHGYILNLTPTDITVGVDQVLSLDVIERRLAAFDESIPNRKRPILFRIDKDELMSGMSRVRDNLAQLFYVDGDNRRLSQVVDLKSPEFEDETAPLDSIAHHSSQLNPNQKQALSKVLTAKDYALILGMPGTGKTTVIATIIKTLVGMGKTVLLTSYTHSAVDNILFKLDDEGDFSILRLGNADKIHPKNKKFTLSARRQATTVEQLEQQIMTPPVVATTCLSLDHALFSRRKFDYCIVDEASQITLPTCLGPLRYADKFVLVGDHFQLPPLVRNPHARKGGLEVSLFRLLSDAHPHAVVDLAYQYRMNSDIMLLSNRLIYSDRLRCGSNAIANRQLTLPQRAFVDSLHKPKSSCGGSECWLEKLLSPSCKAVFVDTDHLPAPDSRVGDLIQNEIEGTVVWQITETLLRSGIQADQIGVLSLYRQQVKLLTQLFQSRPGLEVLTADRSQGRDKDCIIISMVRSNENNQVGDLVKDWRRMNVSFTRARCKLIIIGSRKTLNTAPLLKEFFNLMEEQNWILRLPANGHTMHADAFKAGAHLKRRAVEDAPLALKENVIDVRPQKRIKGKNALSEEKLLRSRPILKDLVNERR